MSEPSLVLQKGDDALSLLTDVRTLIFAFVVDVLEFTEGLDNIQVFLEVKNDIL